MSATKIGENTINILKLMLFTINLYFVTSNQISTYWKLNLPLTSSIYFVFLPLEIQNRLEQTKVYHAFSCFVWKETSHKPLKVAAAINPFLQYVSYWYNLLQWIFFILCDNWKTLFFMKVCRYFEIFLSTMLLLSLKPVFWKKSVFYALPPQYQHDANTKVPRKSCLFFLIFVTNFTLVTVLDVSLQIKFFFINNIL